MLSKAKGNMPVGGGVGWQQLFTAQCLVQKYAFYHITIGPNFFHCCCVCVSASFSSGVYRGTCGISSIFIVFFFFFIIQFLPEMYTFDDINSSVLCLLYNYIWLLFLGASIKLQSFISAPKSATVIHLIIYVYSSLGEKLFNNFFQLTRVYWWQY